MLRLNRVIDTSAQPEPAPQKVRKKVVATPDRVAYINPLTVCCVIEGSSPSIAVLSFTGSRKDLEVMHTPEEVVERINKWLTTYASIHKLGGLKVETL